MDGDQNPGKFTSARMAMKCFGCDWRWGTVSRSPPQEQTVRQGGERTRSIYSLAAFWF